MTRQQIKVLVFSALPPNCKTDKFLSLAVSAGHRHEYYDTWIVSQMEELSTSLSLPLSLSLPAALTNKYILKIVHMFSEIGKSSNNIIWVTFRVTDNNILTLDCTWIFLNYFIFHDTVPEAQGFVFLPITPPPHCFLRIITTVWSSSNSHKSIILLFNCIMIMQVETRVESLESIVDLYNRFAGSPFVWEQKCICNICITYFSQRLPL